MLDILTTLGHVSTILLIILGLAVGALWLVRKAVLLVKRLSSDLTTSWARRRARRSRGQEERRIASATTELQLPVQRSPLDLRSTPDPDPWEPPKSDVLKRRE